MAQEFLLAMSRLRANELLKLKDAVIVTKAVDGDVKVTETISSNSRSLTSVVSCALVALSVMSVPLCVQVPLSVTMEPVLSRISKLPLSNRRSSVMTLTVSPVCGLTPSHENLSFTASMLM